MHTQGFKPVVQAEREVGGRLVIDQRIDGWKGECLHLSIRRCVSKENDLQIQRIDGWKGECLHLSIRTCVSKENDLQIGLGNDESMRCSSDLAQ